MSKKLVPTKSSLIYSQGYWRNALKLGSQPRKFAWMMKKNVKTRKESLYRITVSGCCNCWQHFEETRCFNLCVDLRRPWVAFYKRTLRFPLQCSVASSFKTALAVASPLENRYKYLAHWDACTLLLSWTLSWKHQPSGIDIHCRKYSPSKRIFLLLEKMILVEAVE